MEPIILFDGYCNLCNKSVNFILKHDRKHQFRFAPLQSDSAKKLMENFSTSGTEKIKFLNLPDSVILVLDGKIYSESAAVIKITSVLGFPWSFLSIFQIFPLKWRDGIYKWIARNRYKWFGEKNTCRLPNKEEQKYFLK